jgi:hypothetical protein
MIIHLYLFYPIPGSSVNKKTPPPVPRQWCFSGSQKSSNRWFLIALRFNYNASIPQQRSCAANLYRALKKDALFVPVDASTGLFHDSLSFAINKV